MQRSFRIQRFIRFEFWPYWLFYLPLIPFGIWEAVKSGSFCYFTAVNPTIPGDGEAADSKSIWLSKIPCKNRLRSILIPPGNFKDQVTQDLIKHEIGFPFVIKPDVGSRGFKVEKIENEDQLAGYLEENHQITLIAQEWSEKKMEGGLLFYRDPIEGKVKISSLLIRKFLTIKGDGISRINDILLRNERAFLQLKKWQKQLKGDLEKILEEGEEIMLEPIGNHNRGTVFLDGRIFITDEVIQVFASILNAMDGVHYGRIDFKFNAIEDLSTGENIDILEVNGVGSEPGHIYQPAYSLLKAYRELIFHVRLIGEIGRKNHKEGVKYKAFWPVYRSIWKNFILR